MKAHAKSRAYLRYAMGVLREKPLLTLANIACNALIFSHAAAVAYLVRLILNTLETGVQGNALREIMGYLGLLIAVSLVRIIAIMGCAALDCLRSYYYRHRLRSNMLRLWREKDDVTQVTGQSGRLFELADDDVPACLFPPELLTEVTGFCIFTLIALGTLLSINWRVTLFIFLPLSAAIYGIQKLSEHMKEKRKANREAHDDVSTFIGDVTDSMLAIQTAGVEAAVLAQFGEKNRFRREAVLRDALFNTKVEAMLSVSVSLGVVIMMCICAGMLARGTFRIGDFAIFVGFIGSLASCVDRIVELFYEGKKAEVSYERIVASVGAENAPRLLDDAGITLRESVREEQVMRQRFPLKEFRVEDLSFSYGEKGGFRDVSFSVAPGELVVVAGGVGSGKSTLLGVLSGAMRADGGQLLWNGEAIPDYRTFCVPPNVAFSPQRIRFFSTDIETNLCLGYPAEPKEMAHAAALAALQDTLAGMKNGLHTQIGNRGELLSGGQRQRLSLARMFVRDAELNIIDDCVSALDEQTQLQIRNRLLAHLRSTGHVAIIATNASVFLEAADRILYMQGGAMVADTRDAAQSSAPSLP